MLWLERPPLARWVGAALLVAVAAWSELAPPPRLEARFLVEDVAAGTPLTSAMVETRLIGAPGVATVLPHGVAATDLEAGDPLTASMITDVAVPPGWLLVDADLPRPAHPGAAATAVVVPAAGGGASEQFPALVVDTPAGDPFDSEGHQSHPPESGEEDGDGGIPGDGGNHQSHQHRAVETHRGGYVQRRLQAPAGDGRDAEQERVTGGLDRLEVAGEPGGDGGAGSADAGEQGQGLGEADQEGVFWPGPGQVLLAVGEPAADEQDEGGADQ
ncbi:MAG TPA: hypothetical protein VE173_08080, partial [Longimicrobiales bacterium]|nr:hypothetical protein [Longimicrobiales bacterium]